MNREENDPDTLQLQDELDADWVKLWRRATNKKRPNTNGITVDIILPKKTTSQAQLKSKNTR